MALFRPVELQWISELNAKNDAVMSLGDVQFGPGEVTTAEELASKGKDSKCLMTGINSMYYGSTYLYYDRINLATAFANQLIKLRFYPPIDNFYNQLENFNDYFASVFTQDDLENFDIDLSATEGTVQITAKPTSRCWQGSVMMAYEVLEPEKVLIPDVLLDGVMTPNDSILLEQASLRYAAYDFIVDADVLLALPLGPLSAANVTALKSILATYDSTPWQETGIAPYSLDGAEVLFTGQRPAASEWIINYNLSGDTRTHGVCVVQLSDKSTTAVGTMYLHFHKDL